MNYKQLLEELLKQYHNGDIDALNLNQNKYRYEISYQDTKNNDGKWMNFSFPTDSYLELLTGKGKGELEVVETQKTEPILVENGKIINLEKGDELIVIDKVGLLENRKIKCFDQFILDDYSKFVVEGFDYWTNGTIWIDLDGQYSTNEEVGNSFEDSEFKYLHKIIKD